MKLPSQFAFITLLAAVVSWVCGLGGGEKREPVLRVGIHPAPGYELLFLAEEKGFFRDEGLEVRLVEFTCLADCRRAFERGQVDFVGSAAVQVPVGREPGRYAPKIVDVSDGANAPDGRVTTGHERTEEVAKFLRALSRAITYTKQNQADACRSMARRSRPLPDDVSAAATQGVDAPAPPVPASEFAPGGRAAGSHLALWQKGARP